MTEDSALDVLDVALAVAQAVERAGGEYFVGGSMASSLQGEPRATNDVDFVISLPTSRLNQLRDALGDDFEVDSDMLQDAVQRGACANIFHLPTAMKVDIFGVGGSRYDEAEFSRRRRVRVAPDGRTLVVKAPEDTVLRKLLWYRDGGGVSDRQWRDLVSVLRVSGETMSQQYLCQWAEELGIGDLLQRAKREASGG